MKHCTHKVLALRLPDEKAEKIALVAGSISKKLADISKTTWQSLLGQLSFVVEVSDEEKFRKTMSIKISISKF